jgi:hypothetical protein
MSKKQQKATEPAVNIMLTKEKHDDVKRALWMIDQMQEFSWLAPKHSDGFMFVMTDMAQFIRETLGIVEED